MAARILTDMNVKLLETLEKLRLRLNRSGLERTLGMKDNVDAGEDCYLYKKSLDIFLTRDYVDILKLFKEVAEQFSLVEGK